MEVPDTAPEPTVVAVLGSCATRDNFNRRFNPTYRESYTCEFAANQMSIIALMSPPVLDEWQPVGKMSDYNRWNVESEFSRSFLADLARVRPAYVIVDFFADIHFGVLRLEDGRYVTDNRWKVRKTDWYQRLAETGGFTRLTVLHDHDEYLALWKDAFERFVAYVGEHSPTTRIIVHRGLNTDRVTVPGRPRPVKLRVVRPKITKLPVVRANRIWRELDDLAIATSGASVIDLTDTPWTTSEDHPWGPFYVHFPPEYNHRFLAELHKIVLADRLPSWVLRRVGEVEEPRLEVARMQAEALEARVSHLRTELDRSREQVAPTQQRGRLRRLASRARSSVRRRLRR